MFQGVFYGPLAKRLGLVQTTRVALALFAVAMATQPLCSLSLRGPPGLQKAVLVAHFCFASICRVVAFITVFIFVANAPLQEVRGRVNGLAQAAVSAMRAVSPPIFTSIFAWSVGPSAPLGVTFAFTWWLVAAVTLLTLWQSYALPPWIERKRLPTD